MFCLSHFSENLVFQSTFVSNPIPKTVESYLKCVADEVDFVVKMNQRIKNHTGSVQKRVIIFILYMPWKRKRSGAFFIGKEGNARDGRSLLALSLILPLYMSGEELIWEAAMMIF